MVYMAAVMAAAPAAGSAAHTHGHGPPVLTGALLLYFAGYVLLTGVRLIPGVAVAGGGAGGDGAATAGWGDRPELARACRLAMAIGMLAMLPAM